MALASCRAAAIEDLIDTTRQIRPTY
jgi:hypothetical protein